MTDTAQFTYFVTCPKGLEQLLEAEARQLGAETVKQTVAGIRCQGELALGYRLCLWSRLASRVLLQLHEASVESADDLYQAVQSVEWLEHLRPSGTLTVDFNGQSRGISNTHFGALKVKDAVVDQIRARTGQRPSIERQQPDLRINVHLAKGQAAISLDLSGASLHQRGYRQRTGTAPMKENLAAAVLLRCGWPQVAEQRPWLVDPMCGSGTLLIEAALMTTDTAPGLFRHQFGFMRWLKHDRALWQTLCNDAQQRSETGRAACKVCFKGYDQDAQVLERARENADRARVSGLIEWQQASLADLRAPETDVSGVLVTNPPYGERMGDTHQLMFLYRQLGGLLRQHFAGWQAGVFTSNPDLCKAMGLKAHRQYQMFNGALESRLFLFEVFAQRSEAGEEQTRQAATGQLSEQAQMLVNRLQKNRKQLSRWLKREQIECYRLYDADLPEYAVAVDCYGERIMVQEYQAPASVDPVRAFMRLSEALAAVAQVMEVPVDDIVLKQRKRQQGAQQYERRDHTNHFFAVQEHGCTLEVNLHDYLDTGLFLDHRPVRRAIQAQAAGKAFLNLFCYTGAATVHAAVGGAETTTSVDMSTTYLEWARRNLALNGLDNRHHRRVREDCLKWLQRQSRAEYDLIFMDPPTFSNSKRMEGVLDVQRDHVQLVEGAMRLLREDGVLIFSNNYRRFKLDPQLAERYEVKDITARTLDPDFKRNARIHCCFEIRHRR